MVEKIERCIEAFLIVVELGCSRLLLNSNPFGCCRPLCNTPSYLSDNNIHNEMLMGDKTLTW